MYRRSISHGLGSTIPDLITSTANQYGVPPALAVAVAQQESGMNQSAVGVAGEIGVFQLMPATAAGLGVDPTSLTQNIQGGVSYLSQLYQRFGNWLQALEAYNAGPNRVATGNVPSSSQSYAAGILASSGASAEIPATTPLPTPSESLTAEPDSSFWDFSAVSVPFSGSDPLVLVGLALLGIGLVWWATG